MASSITDLDSRLSRAAPPVARWLASAGAVFAALSVALSAYAAHAAVGEARSSLMTAAVFAFGHGVALAALSPRALRRLALAALSMLLLGTLLFAGGIALSRLASVQLGTAPFGGTLLIAGWLLYAVDALRRG